MAMIGYPEIFLAVICFLVLGYLTNKSQLLINWPLVGMLPQMLLNVHRLYDWLIYIAEKSEGTYLVRGPWFANMDMLGTVNPANVQYIMSTNFANYPKGTEFQKMFDIFGDGLFSSDYDSWKYQRKIAKSLTTTRQFLQVLVKTSRDKVEKGLIPVLEHVCTHGLVVDLQSLVHRFSLDIGITLVTGYDPQNLSINLPRDPLTEAMDVVEDIIFYRHITPEIFWKLQRWLGFGLEPKMKKAWDAMDNIIADYISRKREELGKQKNLLKDGEFADLLTSYINMEGEISRPDKDQFMRDTMFNFLVAGRENSLSWFFWLVYTNPRALAKIREELNSLVPANEGDRQQLWHQFDNEDLKKLVYLHAAMCESLRLYSAVPVEHKAPIEPDVLPSGHRVNPKMKIIFSAFVMGRMKFIWGEDCLEFKPERFITEGGRIKQVPSYKFVAFNTGPRTCIGKEIALTQMKAMAAAVIHNYDVQVVEGHSVVPHCASILLHMKHGLMVRIRRRWK
ncbi:hypothetical protein Tsubulata_009467 [Turnera subulata]|uniref:Alkane hydroxylase MAH1-like n=1 Tax=Turnera subulata TaxID=218843 RepID=A0A9Q0JSA0_9ROSI|nr:hypothetical protein Tsubulata_009467 [Turnera subulata]